jgi:methionyl-tRNA synthetase
LEGTFVTTIHSKMAAEKKCPHCGKWTNWNNQPSDLCEHCNTVLDPHSVKLQQEWVDVKQRFHETNFYRTREGDNFLMIAVRKTAMVGHAIFAAITWIFLWFTTTFAG